MFLNSRYEHCVLSMDNRGFLSIDERVPFRYFPYHDNRTYISILGDTWWGIAHLAFQGTVRPCGLYWLLCEFQPIPVLDPTLVIKQGTVIIIPSLRVLNLEVFSEKLRDFH